MKHFVPEVVGSDQMTVGPAPVLVGPIYSLKDSNITLALLGATSITGSHRAYFATNTPWIVAVTSVSCPVLVQQLKYKGRILHSTLLNFILIL